MRKIKSLFLIILLSSTVLSCSMSNNQSEEKDIKYLTDTYYISLENKDINNIIKEYESITFKDSNRFIKNHTSFGNNYIFHTDQYKGYYKLQNNKIYYFEDENCNIPYYFLNGNNKKDLCYMNYNYSTNTITCQSKVFNLSFTYNKKTKSYPLNNTYTHSMDLNSGNTTIKASIILKNNFELGTKYEEIEDNIITKDFKSKGYYKIIDNFVCFFKDIDFTTPLIFNGFNCLKIYKNNSTSYLYAVYNDELIKFLPNIE